MDIGRERSGKRDKVATEGEAVRLCTTVSVVTLERPSYPTSECLKSTPRQPWADQCTVEWLLFRVPHSFLTLTTVILHGLSMFELT
jgi:hypothetical protein